MWTTVRYRRCFFKGEMRAEYICWFQSDEEANSGEKKRPWNFYCNKRVVFQRCMNWNKETKKQRTRSAIATKWKNIVWVCKNVNPVQDAKPRILWKRMICCSEDALSVQLPGWGVRRKHFSWAVQTFFFFFYSYSSYSSRHLWWEALSRSRQCVPVAPITMHG